MQRWSHCCRCPRFTFRSACPSNLLPDVRKYNAKRPLLIHASLVRSDGKQPRHGSLRFIDNTVDNTTGTIKLKAEFPEPRSTRSGLGNSSTCRPMALEHDRILVPSRTVQTGPQGKYVWVMNAAESNRCHAARSSAAECTNAPNGRTVGDRRWLAAGEMVISEGQMRLLPGVKVQVLGDAPASACQDGAPWAHFKEAHMQFTDLFIRRAITTTLVMAAILIFGILSYFSLPVSNLPAVEYPTIQVQRIPAGRQSGHHGVVRGHAARSRVLHHRRHQQHVVVELARLDVDHFAVRSEPQYRCCRAGRAGRYLARAEAICRPTCRLRLLTRR